MADIIRAARRLVVDVGAEGLSLRPVANELGMTAPALYRYFPSREELLHHVVADIYDELASDLRTARDAVDDPVEQLLVVARDFRRWALAHRREFGLVFAYPIRMTPTEVPLDDPSQPAGIRFAAVFAESLAELYATHPFRIDADDDIEPRLRDELTRWQQRFPIALPLGALLVFLTGWIRIYGLVCMEAFGHLRFALKDGEPMFEHEILALAERLRAPARGGRTSGPKERARRDRDRSR